MNESVAALEIDLVRRGWAVVTNATGSDRSPTNGPVPATRGYRAELIAPTGETYSAQGRTRNDAIRAVAAMADQLEPTAAVPAGAARRQLRLRATTGITRVVLRS
jgi:hypothetical protein